MREAVLRILQQEKHISGEDISRRLDVSRTAIWKHVNALRRLGYKIDSAPHSGYSFIASPDLLLPDEVGFGLNTAFIGKNLLYAAETTSTQDIAEQAARRGDDDGTVVIAEKQTSGRGRKNRHWISPSYGGVYLSALLRPRLRPDRTLQIPLIAGVAAARAIQAQTQAVPALKWPNDILLNGKKAGGILTEMRGDMDEVHHVILGIGLNVNASIADLPETLQKTAISLTDACGHQISRVKLVQSLLTELEHIYLEFIAHGFKSIRREWLSFSQTIGSDVRVVSGSDVINGKAVDIDEDGFLLVKEINGHITKIVSGDVFPASLKQESRS